jgi:hypothetical protein
MYVYHISFFGLSLSPTHSAERRTTWSGGKLIQEFRILVPNENTNISQCPAAGLSCEFYSFLQFSIICVHSSEVMEGKGQ